ncbi:MAG: leucine-rich repeat domain-containing protein, partial [Prevotella sp.]|nr:leucine-rich repeat domain-containing protein [Prevotella sp.]
MKHLKLTFLLTMLMSMVGAKAFAHDIEVQNTQGKTIYYTWTNNNTELAVSYLGSSYYEYSNEYSGNVVIPGSVTYNGKEYSVTSIGNYAFDGCSGLISVTIPNSVTGIDNDAFYYCTGLTSVTIGNSVTTIGNSAFHGCSGLTSITIPNSVTTIGDDAFYGCSKLTAVTIPNSVKYIWGETFQDCTSLTAVTIGNSVTYIGEYAFKGCSSLTSVTIPNSVTNIFSEAFQDCSGLTSVIIGNSVRSIQEYAFSGCSSLTAVTVMNPSPVFIQSSTFSNRANATLYVPIGSKAAYEAANYWRKFKEIVEIDPRTEQTLALSEIPTLTVGDAPYELPATTNEGLALNWSVGNNRIAVISEGKLIVK